MATISENIKRVRAKQGLTQDDLAKKANIKYSTLTKIEGGVVTKPSVQTIQKIAKENGGVPLGKGRFQKETGINEYECLKFWPSFGEAQREAGFEPNTLQVAHSIELLKESV